MNPGGTIGLDLKPEDKSICVSIPSMLTNSRTEKAVEAQLKAVTSSINT